jgi:hypothetical protein
VNRLLAIIVTLTPLLAATPAGPQVPESVVSDTVYNAIHPTLFFSQSEVPALQAKVVDGGLDDLAYQFIRDRVHNHYATQTPMEMLEEAYGLAEVINAALVSHFEVPTDTLARSIGRSLTLAIADSFAVDNDAWGSSLRLRNLAIGYDMLLGDATEAQRQRVLDEIVEYLLYMVGNVNYDIWHHRPYVSNKTAMVASAMGLAAIGLRAELGSAMSSTALGAVEDYIADWEAAHLELDGAYREGVLYGLWSMRNLIYYFEARRRYDGLDHSAKPAIRNMAEWLVYELDPRGVGSINNLQDCTDFFRPLARHTTYFDWAATRWNSELAGYLALHGPGAFGVDMGDDADKAGTVLWGQPPTVIDPGETLPSSRIWTERGLYYHRTGWPFLFDSDDVVFSFYSGKFHGGHAQEDQNQFTLTGYGDRLVIDHGAGNPAKESEAHNLVLIDGAGQHNAGNSIGTDGRIDRYLVGDYFDFLVGDATQAYRTYSPYNENGVPYPGTIWDWGYEGANPVNYALRTAVTVHEAQTRPFFVIADDIEKDGSVHEYEWRLHTSEEHSVLANSAAVQIEGGSGALDVLVVNPCPDSVVAGVSYFDNGAEDENSQVISLTTTAVDPRFVMILLPRPAAESPPSVSTTRSATGTSTAIDWGNGYSDLVMTAANDCGAGANAASGAGVQLSQVVSDARLAVVRMFSSSVTQYLMVDGTTLWCGGIERVRVDDGPATVSKSQNFIFVDRIDAEFSVYSPEDIEVYYHDILVPTTRSGDYLVFDTASSVERETPRAGAIGVRAFPNPFNPDVRISLRATRPVEASVDIYDVAGRHVAAVWDGLLRAGENRIAWDGTDDNGTSLSSGVYFLRVAAGGEVHTTKLTLVK